MHQNISAKGYGVARLVISFILNNFFLQEFDLGAEPNRLINNSVNFLTERKYLVVMNEQDTCPRKDAITINSFS